MESMEVSNQTKMPTPAQAQALRPLLEPVDPEYLPTEGAQPLPHRPEDSALDSG